jgi:hypothetical protein
MDLKQMPRAGAVQAYVLVGIHIRGVYARSPPGSASPELGSTASPRRRHPTGCHPALRVLVPVHVRRGYVVAMIADAAQWLLADESEARRLAGTIAARVDAASVTV